MEALARWISDGAMLRILKMWLEAPVVEKDEKTGRPRISTYN
jgi:hypothetical protein